MKKNTTYRPAPTKLNDETKTALLTAGIDPERAASGVGRGGRLIQIDGIDGDCFVGHDQDKLQVVFTAPQARKHFA